jgi:uncharacterized RDD family membrane protein YckC
VSENPPGWYKDPAEPTTQRYWDGEGWLGAPLPAGATPPAEPPVPKPPAEPTDDRPATLPPAALAPANVPPPALPPTYPPTFPPTYPPPGAPAQPPYQPPGGLPTRGIGPGGAVPPPGTILPPGMPPPGWPAGVPFPGAVVVDIRPHGYALAPLGRRLVARLIDIGMVLVLSSIANGFLLYQYIKELSPYFSAFRRYIATSDQTALDNLPSNDARASTLSLVITVILMAVWIAYEVPFIAAGGQTLGKRIMGIRVIPLEGVHPLGTARALRRWSTLGLPTLLWSCGVGFIIQFIASLSPTFNRPLHLAMHDRAAATVVVSASGRMPAPTESTPTDTTADTTTGGSP